MELNQKFFLFKQNSTLLYNQKHKQKRKIFKSHKEIQKKALKKLKEINDNYFDIKNKESTDDNVNHPRSCVYRIRCDI